MKHFHKTIVPRLPYLAILAGFAIYNVSTLSLKAEDDSAVDGVSEIVNKTNSDSKSIAPTSQKGTEDQIEEAIENRLSRRLLEDNIEQGWDESKERYIGIASYTEELSSDADLEEYFDQRQVACLGAMLRAQISIATFLGTQAKMEVALRDPGNPVFNEAPNAALKKQTEARIASLRKELAAANIKLEDGGDWTTADRVKTAADAIIKKIDKDYDPAKAVEEKMKFKQKVEGAAREIELSLSSLEEKLQEYQQAYRKSASAGINLSYDHVVYGLTALAWAENYSPSGELTVGLIYAWGPKMARKVRAAMTGDLNYLSDAEKSKGTESLESWIKKQQVDTVGAFRYFIDDKGSAWFIGTGFCPKDVSASDQVARLDSIMNLYMPLNSKLIGSQLLERKVDRGSKGKKSKAKLPAKIKKEFIENLTSTAEANTRGLTTKRTSVVAWPVIVDKEAGKERVVVTMSALSAKSASDALKSAVEQAEHAAAVVHENNRRLLEQKQLNQIVDSAKSETPVSRVPGLRGSQKGAVNSDVNGRNIKKPTSIPSDNVNSGKSVKPAPVSRDSQGKLQDDF